MRTIVLVLWLCFAVMVSAAEKRPRVVTSFLPVYSWTANIAGDLAEVENLLGAGSDPHAYSFSRSDVNKLSNADVVIIHGLGLEDWLPVFRRSTVVPAGKVVSVTDGLQQQLLYGEHSHHHHHGPGAAHNHGGESANEHTWLDPQLAAHAVTNILLALQGIDPANAAGYASNAFAYVRRLQVLDNDIRQMLAGVTNRAIVTYHDAFPYFAKRYGLEIAGIVEKTPSVSPTPKHLTQLGKVIRARNIPVIFVPPGGRSTLTARLARDLKVQLAELDTLESGLLSASAYEERMRKNAAVLKAHLK